jgi:DMSO/TMAO reductase YedYZ molybdopterin-dependent catalytic subunit
MLAVLLIFGLIITGCQGLFPADDAYTVEITGSGVAAPVQVSLKQMKEMEAGLVEANYFSLNTYGTKEYTDFRGVWLWHLLQESAGLTESARTVTLTAEDGYQVSFTLEEVKREDYIDEQDLAAAYKMIIAWEQAGEAFDPEKGNPFQLVVGQREPGDVNKPYWVRNISTIEVE